MYSNTCRVKRMLHMHINAMMREITAGYCIAMVKHMENKFIFVEQFR